jgi:hypothetical protein
MYAGSHLIGVKLVRYSVLLVIVIFLGGVVYLVVHERGTVQATSDPAWMKLRTSCMPTPLGPGMRVEVASMADGVQRGRLLLVYLLDDTLEPAGEREPPVAVYSPDSGWIVSVDPGYQAHVPEGAVVFMPSVYPAKAVVLAENWDSQYVGSGALYVDIEHYVQHPEDYPEVRNRLADSPGAATAGGMP